MTLVIVCAAFNLPWPELQFRLGPIEGLNLSLFINRQNQRIIQRIQIEACNVAHFLGKVRIITDFEGSEPARL